MEGGAVETSAAPDHKVKPVSMACLRRQAWARSRESIWQESKPEQPQAAQQTPDSRDAQRPSEEPGQVPNNITSWLSECRTPLGASLDDQSPSPSKGPLRNGCSFEDDLSLGAEANHLQSNSTKPESCFGLAADQKRSQYKEKGRSMNSTGSGKSSTVSSVSEKSAQSEEPPVEIHVALRVSELLDLYEEDPEEILFNLGFGREEPDLNAKIPSRFFNGSSSARGIDIKVYLKAQLQRMELENPNYALTSRFRQIEVLTTVANEFFQLYSQVSGQPVQRISSKDQEVEGEEEGRSVEQPPPLKKSNSALNVAKLLKRTISKHNLLAASPESPEANAQLNGHSATSSDRTQDKNHTHASPEKEECNTNSDHKAETGGKKLVRNKDNCSLATVTEESGGETDRLSESSPEECSGGPESAALQLSSLSAEEEGVQVIEEEEEKNQISTQEKAAPTLTPPLLAQLRTENTDSFDMEEIQSNEDETLPTRTSRATDLLRTVSQQSDSSGFAEDPSTDSCNYLKVQESSDSCDSETTVTSHPSQEVVTPIALDQPVFVLPDTRRGEEEEAGPGDSVETDGRSSSVEGGENKVMLEQILQYTAHQLPKLRGMGAQQDDSLEEEPEPETSHCVGGAEQEQLLEIEHSQNQSLEQDLQHVENPPEASTNPPAEKDCEEDRKESMVLDDQTSLNTPVPSYQVLSALNRAKQSKLARMGQRIIPENEETPESRGRGRRSTFRLQRSSSLPSSLPSPSRIVSSVKIQLGRGRTSSSQPRYSVKYPQEDGGEKEEEELEEEGSANVLSTLIINPGSSSGKKTTSSLPPKPVTSQHLMRSCHSLQSYSPPPESFSWSTQSVPDLCSNHQPPSQFSQTNLADTQKQESWTQVGPTTLPNHNPPPAPYFDPIPSPSPSFNPYLSSLNTHPHSPLHPYASLPNLHHHRHPSVNPHPHLANLHQPASPSVPPHYSMSNLHHPSPPSTTHAVGPAHPHPATPPMHYQGYNHPYTPHSPYYAAPYQFASPYLTYQGYSVNSHLAFHHTVPQYPPPPMTLEHSLYPGLAPSTPGFIPSPFNPGHNLHSGLPPPPAAPGSGPSSTEMQLRRVLHDIRGTIQSLSENRADTPDMFSDHRAALPTHQSLGEFQQRRRSLNLFRRQMMDLELSIMQQQALVYNHLSPADRMEVEKLQSLRSNVREELQELEQQLEERLVELMHNTQQRSHRSNSSVDNLSTASALRAMEPVSDLLSEQLFLRSELSYDGLNPSTDPSTRSSSPLRGGGGGGGYSEQKQGLYRTTVDITPVPPPRPNTHTKKEEGAKEGEEEEKQQRDNGGGGGEEEEGGGGGGRGEAPEEKVAAEGVGLDNLQQLIREIRESVAQEVRQEIYGELLAAVTPQRSPVQTVPKQQRL